MKKKINNHEMQKIELNILTHFHEICQKYRIRYVLAYGSCIGAIRHNGFIPWDDDIDVLVPASDYNRLLSVLSSESGIFSVKNIYNDNNYLYSYAKLTDSRTLLCEEFDSSHNMGIYIDIFPVYGLPANPILRILRFCYIQFQEILCISVRQPIPIGKSRVRTIIQKCLSVIGKKIGLKKLNRSIIRLAKKTSYETATFYSVLPPNYGFKEILDFDLFERRELHSFENSFFYVSFQSDKYLRQIYGNYMKLPSENERRSHHFHVDVFVEEEDK